jgi:hypothetical protein
MFFTSCDKDSVPCGDIVFSIPKTLDPFTAQKYCSKIPLHWKVDFKFSNGITISGDGLTLAVKVPKGVIKP